MNLRLRLVSTFASALFAACHGSAEIVVTDSHPIYFESEPNDDALGADQFGFLHAGEHFGIAGNVHDDPFDPQDGFAFVAAGAIVVDFELEAACDCADLDLWLYDPVLDEFVGVFDSKSSTERGSFTVYGQEFHMIVVSALGDTGYRLDLSASSFETASSADSSAVSAATDGLAIARARLDERAPTATLERYRAALRSTGAPQIVEFFTIDPELGVVGRTTVATPN